MIVVLPNLPNLPGRHRHAGDVLGWIAGGLATGFSTGLSGWRSRAGLRDTDPSASTSWCRWTGARAWGGTVQIRSIVVLVIGLGIGLIVEQSLVRSRVGLSMRAVADDPEGAALCGVSARRVVMSAFGVAGVLAGIAGVLAAPARAISVDDGAILGLAAAAAALLGGLGSLRGALGGGLN